MMTVELRTGLWCRWASSGEVATIGPMLHEVESSNSLPRWRARRRRGGHALLGSLLVDCTGMVEDALAVRRTPRGKPLLADYPGIGISVSYTTRAVAAAVFVGGAVGVDIECPDGPASQERLWRWTVLEALTKTTGEGLAARPWTWPVSGDHGTLGGVTWESLRGCSRIPMSVAWRPSPADGETVPIGEGR